MQPYIQMKPFAGRLFLLFAFCAGAVVFAPAQAVLLDTVFLIRAEVIRFDFGESDLTQEYDSLLSETARWYADQPDIQRIEITGHTDAIGGDRSNFRLSMDRTAQVRQKLVQEGIPDSLFTISNYGESLPVGSNETETGRAFNRRVTVDFLQQAKAILLHGQLIDDNTREGVAGQVIASVKGVRDSLATDSLGYFQVLLPFKGILSLQGFALQYYFNSQVINPNLSLPDTLIQVPLRKIKTGEIIEVENLYYISNTPVLIDRSKPELDKLVLFMKLNPDVSIEIAGHVNVPGKTRVSERSWQYELSYLRAKMVYNHLLANGISAFRMRYKGYGNWQMRFQNPGNAEEAQLNRRVEIRILNDGTLK